MLRAVKAAVAAMPVIYRLSVEDFFPGGLPFREGRQIAIWAAQAGADALHVTAGHYRSLPSAQIVLPPMRSPGRDVSRLCGRVKKPVRVPVIAVGRLGDPAIADEAVATGKTDFVALGRTLIADPQWVEKLRRGEPIRRCLACNTCINEMRGGARIGCVVNAAAGRETRLPMPQPPRGERIAVIGAGPAGLTYASLVANGNQVTVFEKDKPPGGAFRYAGKAPLFQEVEASEESFARYIADLYKACVAKGVSFRFGTDVSRAARSARTFDRIVIASGARYRFGLGPLATAMLDTGLARWPGFARLFSSRRFRNWFYYKARRRPLRASGHWGKASRPSLPLATRFVPGKARKPLRVRSTLRSLTFPILLRGFDPISARTASPPIVMAGLDRSSPAMTEVSQHQRASYYI